MAVVEMSDAAYGGPMADVEVALERVSALAEPTRLRIYQQLVREAGPVGRRELAEILGISENLLTFHLDRLAEAGIVRVVPAKREAGRRGRPARQYELVGDEVVATVPPRRYDRIAEVLALAAREQQPDESFQAAAERVATGYGDQLGRQERAQSPSAPVDVTSRLAGLGYQPRAQDVDVVLDNCPYDKLRQVNTPLVCGVNHALLGGYLAALGLGDGVTARLEPDSARCCVVIAGPPT